MRAQANANLKKLKPQAADQKDTKMMTTMYMRPKDAYTWWSYDVKRPKLLNDTNSNDAPHSRRRVHSNPYPASHRHSANPPPITSTTAINTNSPIQFGN